MKPMLFLGAGALLLACSSSGGDGVESGGADIASSFAPTSIVSELSEYDRCVDRTNGILVAYLNGDRRAIADSLGVRSPVHGDFLDAVQSGREVRSAQGVDEANFEIYVQSMELCEQEAVVRGIVVAAEAAPAQVDSDPGLADCVDELRMVAQLFVADSLAVDGAHALRNLRDGYGPGEGRYQPLKSLLIESLDVRALDGEAAQAVFIDEGTAMICGETVMVSSSEPLPD